MVQWLALQLCRRFCRFSSPSDIECKRSTNDGWMDGWMILLKWLRIFLVKLLKYLGQAFPDFHWRPLSFSLFLHPRKSPFCPLLIHNSSCQSFTNPSSLQVLQSEATGPGSVTFSNHQLLLELSFVSDLTTCNRIYSFQHCHCFQSSLLLHICSCSHLLLPLFWF